MSNISTTTHRSATLINTTILLQSAALPVTTGPNAGDNAFVIICTALVFFMTPGVGYFYSGMARMKNALSLIFLCFLSMAIVLIQWVAFGFSLSFSDGGNFFIGDFDYAGLKSVSIAPLSIAPTVNSVTFMLYQAMFATISPALIFGSTAERLRIGPSMLFILLWSTFVYDFLAYWTWAQNGWLHTLDGVGTYDFAGGTPVHISSGFSGLAMAIVLGKRHNFDTQKHEWKPHSLSNVFMGTAMLWFGWYGFNGGSALAGSARAAMAATVTTVAAAAGGLTWVFLDFPKEKKLSALGFCSGAVAGLVGITPGSGFVAPWAAIVIGTLTAIICNIACRIKHHIGLDDTLDVFGVHGVGGFVGNLFTGIFAQKWIAELDGNIIAGGWMDGHWMQFVYQMAGSFAGAAWAFLVSGLIVFIMQHIPYLELRLPKDHEEMGVDLAQMGEMAYWFDNMSIESIASNNHSTDIKSLTSNRMTSVKVGPIQTLYDQFNDQSRRKSIKNVQVSFIHE